MGQTYKLLNIVERENIDLYYLPLQGRNKGLYGNGIIAVSKDIDTESELSCVLAEELGHYYTSAGNILDQKDVANQKQEIKARRWAHRELIPLHKFIECFNCGCRDRFETAEHLDVTEKFLDEAIEEYKRIYGVCTRVDDYVVYFEPLGVMKLL